MAASIKVYGHLGFHLQAGGLAWASDTIKLALTTSGYAVSQANDEYFSAVTNELSGSGGYTSGGFTLTGCALSYDATTREERFDATDFSVSALTPSAPFRYGVIYKDTGTAGTSFLIAYINFGADQDPAGLPFAVQWPTTGVWYAQAV
jgi:hypothetical protein